MKDDEGAGLDDELSALTADGVDMEEGLVCENPVTNFLQYTAMRLVRLVGAILCELGAVFFAAVSGAYGALLLAWFLITFGGFFGIMLGNLEAYVHNSNDWAVSQFGIYAYKSPFDALGWYPQFFREGSSLRHWAVLHPYISGPVVFALFFFFLGQAMSLGLPYRYNNSPPGCGVVRCAHCKRKISEALLCPHCRVPRIDGFAVKVIWVFNLMVSCLWGFHDGMLLILGFAGRKK